MDLGAVARDGQLDWFDPDRVAAYLKRHEGKRMHVQVEPMLPRRTISQNKMIWSLYSRALKECAAYTGHTAEELHGWMKEEFLVPELKLAPDGSVLGLSYSTKNLDITEASEYIERVLAKFASYGVAL